MIKQTPGRIFLADRREILETAQSQRCSMYQGSAPHAGGFESLHEESLLGGAKASIVAKAPAYVLLIPITGTVQLQIAGGVPALVHVEEMQVAAVPAGSEVCFANPYPSDMVSFLHLWLHMAEASEWVASSVFGFDTLGLAHGLVAATQILPIVPKARISRQLPFSVSLGRFAGRQEAIYPLSSSAAHVFVYVLAGAFEVEGRLLHEKDGLSLWDTPKVEIEALSNDALMLVVELLP